MLSYHIWYALFILCVMIFKSNDSTNMANKPLHHHHQQNKHLMQVDFEWKCRDSVMVKMPNERCNAYGSPAIPSTLYRKELSQRLNWMAKYDGRIMNDSWKFVYILLKCHGGRSSSSSNTLLLDSYLCSYRKWLQTTPQETIIIVRA